VEQLNTTGIPIITILVEGRPRLLSTVPSISSALIHSYLPGPMGGQAVAEVIYGVLNPNGKIPFTYPRQQADIGYTYAHKVEDQCTSPDNVYSNIPCQVCALFNNFMKFLIYPICTLLLLLLLG
jgi:hypothetical protein